MFKIRHLLLFTLLMLHVGAMPYEATVENLSGDRYAAKVIEEINTAKQSIVLFMYQIEFDADEREAMTTKLLEALTRAKQRGVAIRVLLDQHLLFKEDSTRQEWEQEGKNIQAYEYLQSKGIDVSFISPEVYNHSKVILIDERVLILGSANWSEASLARNQESNVLIRSEELASEMLEELSQVKVQEMKIQFRPNVYVPMAFLEDEDLLYRMAVNNNTLEMDLYLYLLREYNENKKGAIRLDFDHAAKALHLNTLLGQGNYRRKIKTAVRGLKEKTNLLRYEETRDAYWDLFLLDYKNGQKAYQVPLTDSFPIPLDYWTYGWDHRLSMIGKALLFINFAHVFQGDGAQEWFAAIPSLERTYHFSSRALKNGFKELRQWNLVELENIFFDGDSRGEGLNYRYRLSPLYDADVLNDQLQELRMRATSDEVGFAEKIAEVIYKEKDVAVLEQIMSLRKDYGNSALQKAATEIQTENSDSPRRTLVYLEALLKEKTLS